MSAQDHPFEDGQQRDDDRHDASWSANLEEQRHAEDVDRLLAEAVDAVERTQPGYHVNLVTHGDQGHPSAYLNEHLEERFGDAISLEYVTQCGCGGHVTRVQVEP